MNQLKILLVEDELSVAKNIENILKDFGYSVQAVISSGEEAVKKAEMIKPDLIIMDIVLKGKINGIEASRLIRKRFNIPIIFLTAFSEKKSLMEAIETGPFGYILKPVNDKELLVSIEITLARHKLKKKNEENKQRLYTTLKGIGEAVITTDIDEFITFMNPAAENLTGWNQEEASGKPLNDVFNIINEKKGTPAKSPVKRVIQNGKVEALPDNTVEISKNGRQTPIDGSIAPIKDTDGNNTGVILVFRDITEYREMENLIYTQRNLALALSSVSNLKEGLLICIDAALDVSGMDCGGVYLFDKASGALNMIIHKGLPSDFVRSTLHFDADSANVQLILKGKPVYTEHKQLEVPLDEAEFKENLLAVAVIPIKYEDKVIGCLNIASHTLGEILLLNRVMLEMISAQMGSAIARLQTEENLKVSEEKFSNAFYSSNLSMAINTLKEGRYIDVNEKMLKTMGYSREELIGKTIFELNIFHDQKEHSKFIKNLIKDGYIRDLEVRYKTKSGEIRTGITNADIFNIGEEKYVTNSSLDITDRKIAEEALRESEEKYRTILENIEDGYYEVDSAGKLTSFNDSLCRIYGYSEDELMGMNNREYTDEATAKSVYKTFSRVYQTGVSEKLFNWEIIGKDGSRRTIEGSVSLKNDPSGKPVGFRGIVRDVTDKKLMENTLRESEERYRLLADNVTDIIWTADMNGRFTYVSSSVKAITGFSAEEQMKKSIRGVHPPDSLKKTIQAAENELARENDKDADPDRMWKLDLEHYCKDGSTIWIEINEKFLRDFDGKPTGFIGVARDIRERKKMEKLITESEERYRRLIENANDIIYSLDTTGHITFFNPVTIRIMEYPEEELLGIHYLDLIEPEYRKDAERFYGLQYVKKIQSTYYELPAITRSGKILWLGQNVELVLDDDKITGFQTVARDITRQKLAEEQIKASLKEKEILLKEIHHRVKNNMQVISSLLSLQTGYISDAKYHELFINSEKRVRSMALVHEKLYQSDDLAKVNFSEYLNELVSELFSSYSINSEKIKLKIEVKDVYLEIDDAIPCALIINEFISNSLKHAFPGDLKGKIKINFSKDKNNKYILVIDDNGIGISHDMDIKETESLGLQLINALTSQLKGNIKLDRNNGTKFTIIF